MADEQTDEKEIKVVTQTSGDKYIVRTPTPEGYKQELLTKSEIEARGGKVPEPMQERVRIHKIAVEQGTLAAEKERKRVEAAKAPTLPEQPTTPESFGEKYGIKPDAAADTIKRYQDNPKAAEFRNLSAPEIQDLNRAAKLPTGTNLIEVGRDRPTRELVSEGDIEKIKKETPTLADVLVSQGVEKYQEAAGETAKYITKFQEAKKAEALKDYIKLPDGKYISRKEYEILPTNYKEIADTKGATALIDAIRKDKDQLEKDLSTLSPYAIYEGGTPKEAQQPQYDLIAAIRGGIDKSIIRRVFGGVDAEKAIELANNPLVTETTEPVKLDTEALRREFESLPVNVQNVYVRATGVAQEGDWRDIRNWFTPGALQGKSYNQLTNDEKTKVVNTYGILSETEPSYKLAKTLSQVKMPKDAQELTSTLGTVAGAVYTYADQEGNKYYDNIIRDFESIRGGITNLDRVRAKPISWLGGYTQDELIAGAMTGLVKGGLYGIGTIPLIISLAPAVYSSEIDGKSYAKDMGQGFVDFYRKELPKVWGKNPAEAIGIVMPQLFSAARGAQKVASKIYVYAHPKGIPSEVISKEYSTGRIPIGELPPEDLGRAIGEALQEATKPGVSKSGEVTIGGVTVRYLKTPYQRVKGGVLWHGTGDVAFLTKSGGKAGAAGMYLNPYAAEAYITAGDAPGLIMVLADPTKFKTVPNSVLKNITQSDWYVRQAEKGLYQPSKEWRGDFETEIVAAPGTTFETVTKSPSLLQRIITGAPGEYFTEYVGTPKGKLKRGALVPITIVADKGTVKTTPSTAELYAMKLLVIDTAIGDFMEKVKHPYRTLKDIVTGRVGAKGVREIEVSGIDLSKMKNMEGVKTRLQAYATKEAAKAGNVGTKAYKEAYDIALKKEYERISRQYLKEYGREVENAYNRNRSLFEDFYRYEVQNNWASWYRYQELLSRSNVDLSRFMDNIRASEPYSQLREGYVVSSPSYTLSRLMAYSPLSPASRLMVNSFGRIESTPRTTLAEMREPIRDGEPVESRDIKGIRDITDITTRDGEKEREIREFDRQVRGVAESISDKYIQTKVFKYTTDNKGKKRVLAPLGSITWKQGLWWVIIKPPYKQKDIMLDALPPIGAVVFMGKHSAIRTIQALGGDVKVKLKIDVGNQDVTIINPRKAPGIEGVIDFDLDKGNKTRNPLTLSGVKEFGQRKKPERIRRKRVNKRNSVTGLKENTHIPGLSSVRYF